MPRTTTKPAKKSKAAAKSEGAEQAPPAGEVLTLTEAAAYLRLPEAEVERLARTEGLPGRAVGEEWRFLKTALQDWLYGSAPTRPSKEALLARIGSWKDDPMEKEFRKELSRIRGRDLFEGCE